MTDHDAIDAPYRLRALAVRVSRAHVHITMAGGIVIMIPVSTLGEPWSTASARRIANVSLRFGGAWLWWEDIDEGIVLDEFLQDKLLLTHAASLKREESPSCAMRGPKR